MTRNKKTTGFFIFLPFLVCMDYYFLLKHCNPFNILCPVPAFNIYSLGTSTGNKLTYSQWIPIKSAKIRGGKLFFFFISVNC